VSVLTGLQAPDSGQVRFLGEPAPAPGNTAAWQTKVACVYQKSMVVPDLTVAENLFLNRFDRGRIRWTALRSRASDLLAEYGVDVDPTARAGDLTVEQGQFVEIARALSFGARFIILDEPTAQLDPAGTRLVGEALRSLAETGTSLLIAEHKTDLLDGLCSRIVAIDGGRIVLDGPTGAIFDDPRLAELGVEPPARVRLGRMLAERGIDPAVIGDALATAAAPPVVAGAAL
jgi:simple sugar transport system ATP-binding protein